MSVDNLQIAIDLPRSDFHLSVDLSLPGRGISVFFGPSGAGKTTLLRCVAGLDKGIGHVIVGDAVWQDSSKGIFKPVWQRSLGYVFQEASLFEHLRVSKNMLYGVQRVGTASAKRALDHAINLLGITHLLQRPTSTLSGGERQRVAIARALATEPKVLLLDEPLAALDPARRDDIMPWLEQMHCDLEIPVLYVTHSMQELVRLADYVVLLQNGTVVTEDAVTFALTSPHFAPLAGSAAGSLLQGHVTAHDEHFHLSAIDIDGELIWMPQQSLPIGTEVRLHVHANDVSLSLVAEQESSIQNRIVGQIESFVDDKHPAQILIRVRCNQNILLSRVTRRAVAQLELKRGTRVWCQIKSVALANSN